MVETTVVLAGVKVVARALEVKYELVTGQQFVSSLVRAFMTTHTITHTPFSLSHTDVSFSLSHTHTETPLLSLSHTQRDTSFSLSHSGNSDEAKKNTGSQAWRIVWPISTESADRDQAALTSGGNLAKAIAMSCLP